MKQKWMYKYNLLKEYLENSNGIYPKKTEVYKDVNLGAWVYQLRSAIKRGKLPIEKIELLKEIDFKLDAPKREKEKWLICFKLLKEYLELNNGEYPKEGEIYQGVNLKSWIRNQRNIYNCGTVNNNGDIIYNGLSLTKKEIGLLNSIGFIWRERNKRNETFYIEYELLKEYLKDENNILTKKTIYKGHKIGLFASYYYENYIKINSSVHNNNYISDKKIKLLEELNLDKYLISDFDYHFNLLKEYVNEYHKYPEANEVYKGINLGMFIVNIRMMYNNGSLDADNIEKLKSINFEFSKNNQIFNDNLKLYLEFKNEYQREPKNGEKYKGIDIGYWAAYQRYMVKHGTIESDGSIICRHSKLTKEQIDTLNSIGFVWDLKEYKFVNKKITSTNSAYFEKQILQRVLQILKEQKEFTDKSDITKINDDLYNDLGKTIRLR